MQVDLIVEDENHDSYRIGTVIAPPSIKTEQALHDALDEAWDRWNARRKGGNASEFCQYLVELGWTEGEGHYRHAFLSGQ